MKVKPTLILSVLLALFFLPALSAQAEVPAPMPIIFDTDMGNDADDAMALAILNAFVDRGECDLLAVTLTKSAPNAAPYIQMVNSYCGHPDIPIGMTTEVRTPDDGRYIGHVFDLKDETGNPLFVRPEVTPLPAVQLLRQKLAEAEDHSVVIVMVGFSTNMAALLDSPADDISPLTGKELAAQKVKLLSTMFGKFNNEPGKEYNVVTDIPSAQKVAAEWPTPIWFSGYEIGTAVQISREQIDNAFRTCPNHPIRHSFILYRGESSGNQSTYDLTSVLLPLRLLDGYFNLSAMGTVSVDDEGVSHFTEDPNGRCQYIQNVTPEQVIRIREAFLYLMSQPAK